MKAAVRSFLVLMLVIASPAIAQEARLRLYCEACRDIVEHPEDARNFGTNQLYGAGSWLTFDQADRFDIVDPFGNTATIDINITYVTLDLSFLWNELTYPITFILQIRIVYPNGDIVTYRFDLRDLDPAKMLPVPASDLPPPPPDGELADTEEGNEADEDDEIYGAGDYEVDDDFGDDYEPADDSCSACEAYFDADEDGFLDEEPIEWTEEL